MRGSLSVQKILREQKMQRMKILTLVNQCSNVKIKGMLSKIYRQSYKTKKVGPPENLGWRKMSDDGGIVLFDNHYQRNLVYIPETMTDVFLLPPPDGNQEEKRINVDKRIFFDNVPTMPKEVMYNVFKFVSKMELLKSTRLVCKRWNYIIKTTDEYWVHRQWKNSPWKHCPMIEQYIQHTFIGVTQPMFIDFIFRHKECISDIIPYPFEPIQQENIILFGPYKFCRKTMRIWQSGWEISVNQIKIK
jgi:hypothetical protein